MFYLDESKARRWMLENLDETERKVYLRVNLISWCIQNQIYFFVTQWHCESKQLQYIQTSSFSRILFVSNYQQTTYNYSICGVNSLLIILKNITKYRTVK